MAMQSPKQAALRVDDRERMQRLSEEVESRLKEMSMIMSRNLGIELSGDAKLKYERVHPSHIEIICAPDGTCGCYVEPPGICEFPCGST